MENEKEENIWSSKISFLLRRKICEGKGGKYLEKENIWYTEDKKNGDGKFVGEAKSQCVIDNHKHT